MAEDTVNTNETVEEKVTIKTRLGSWWSNNKSKLAWFGVGAVTGAGTIVAAALLLEPTEDTLEGDDEETIEIDYTSPAVES